jgi:hypothetical protein
MATKRLSIAINDMPDSDSSSRFKPEMPNIPGVGEQSSKVAPLAIGRAPTGVPLLRLSIGIVALLLVLFFGTRWILRAKHPDARASDTPPQIEVPAPAPDPSAMLPHASPSSPRIASVSEMTKPWSSREFFWLNSLTGQYLPAMLIRLPNGTARQSNGYWAFVLKAPYGKCQMEYVEPSKLAADYGYRGATHQMVGDPCSRSVFDPAKLTSLADNVWARGAVVAGSDLRPPLAIEIQIQGNDILATRME